MSKSHRIRTSWRTTPKNSYPTETENPFTTIGLITAVIEDLNDIRLKIELIENYLLFKKNLNKFIFKESNEKENFQND